MIQHGWTERKYLNWPELRLVEFDHGQVMELATPTVWHQMILGNLAVRLLEYLRLLARWHLT